MLISSGCCLISSSFFFFGNEFNWPITNKKRVETMQFFFCLNILFNVKWQGNPTNTTLVCNCVSTKSQNFSFEEPDFQNVCVFFVFKFLHKFHPFNFTLFLLESFTLGKSSQAMAVLELGPCSKTTALPAALREPLFGYLRELLPYTSFGGETNGHLSSYNEGTAFLKQPYLHNKL